MLKQLIIACPLGGKERRTGVPFVIVDTEVKECKYGPDRKKKRVCIAYAVPMFLYIENVQRLTF